MSEDIRAWSFHGGRLRVAQAAYPDATGPWIDLSTGINPQPWRGVADLAIDWQRLPDEAALGRLEAAAADFFGVDPDHVCALPGTEIGLRLVGEMLPGPVAHVAPGYRTHAEIAAGSAPIAAGAIGAAASALILANPNNPDGRVTPAAVLLDRLDHSPNWLLVDEAFADALPEASIAGAVRDDRRLIVFRSFGKFFGLAGVRLGFAIGPRDLIGRLRTRIGSWPVSAAALAIGTAAYRDREWIAAMRTSLQSQAAALDALLARHGLTVRGACPLFRLIETGNAVALFHKLAGHAILTRPFDYDPHWLRLGLPDGATALARLDAALAGDG
jgi:cobalamin biosynthetic protein CobC